MIYKQMRLKKGLNTLLLILITSITLLILLEKLNVNSCNNKDVKKKKYWTFAKSKNVEKRNGILKHVIEVLERIGYEKGSNETRDWDLLWSFDYPFGTQRPILNKLEPHQKVNHFPGSGCLLTKVKLATTDSKYVLKAFQLPKNKYDFLRYASKNKNVMFLQKHNWHRGVFLKSVSDIDLSGKSFAQEFLQKPFLVDGHKFDIGVYVVMTSVDPLRLYWYKGDVGFRYCPAKYHPLNASNRDQYVVSDNYLPVWRVPSQEYPFSVLKTSMKEAFDMYVKAQGKEPTKMWEEIHLAIVDIFLKKINCFVNGLMRADLIVDEDLKVYLLEVNMSPNLSSAHHPQNQLLFRQILYSLFSITGVASYVVDRDRTLKDMMSSQKNIAVFGAECSTICKDRCDQLELCKLCKPCTDRKLRHTLLRAHTEFLHRADFRRLFPPPMKQRSLLDVELKHLSESNRLQYLWYQGKCNLDITWCT